MRTSALRRLPHQGIRTLRRARYDSTYTQLHDQGYAVVPGVISQEEISALNDASERLCADPSYAHLQKDKYTGSLIPVSKDPVFAELIAHKAALSVFDELGWGPTLRWMSGFIISKPPYSPSLGWHQDSWYWDQQVAYSKEPAQVFAMYYLTDTTEENGCLRVLPGSHHTPHPLHDELGAAHSEEVRSGGEAWRQLPEHRDISDAVNVAVNAGDLVIGDARVLHGARENQTASRRSLITLWYLPRYTQLSRSMRDSVGILHQHQCGQDLYGGRWDAQDLQKVERLLPDRVQTDLDADEYDHNLSIMHRTPGHAALASAEAHQAWQHSKT